MKELVRQAMTAGVAAVRADASLVEVAEMMRHQDIGVILVAQGDRLIGVLTDRDLVLRAVAEGADPATVSAQAVCSPSPVCVGPNDEITTALSLMRRHAIRRLPVIEDGRPLGVVSLGDLAQARDPESVLADICRAPADNRPDPGL